MAEVPVSEIVQCEVALVGIADFAVLGEQSISPAQHNAVDTGASVDDGLQVVAHRNRCDRSHRSIREHRGVLLV